MTPEPSAEHSPNLLSTSTSQWEPAVLGSGMLAPAGLSLPRTRPSPFSSDVTTEHSYFVFNVQCVKRQILTQTQSYQHKSAIKNFR